MSIASARLHNGNLYWPNTMSNVPSYPALRRRIVTHAAVIGGGMTGAICTSVLARSGIPTVLLEGSKVAAASTAANTGLLQFSNDVMLSELTDRIGEAKAVTFYRECQNAMSHLAVLARSVPFDTGFRFRSSLYCASEPDHIPKLTREYALLRKHRFPVEWNPPSSATAGRLHSNPTALVTHGDAEVNPVRFAHGLIKGAQRKGAEIFEDTKVLGIERRDGHFVIQTMNGQVIAKQIVRAVGYLPGIASSSRVKPRLSRSYAMATTKHALPSTWSHDYMLWETARPYFYFRTTPDGRIIAGGLDEDRANPNMDSAYLEGRTERLVQKLKDFFPESHFEAEYSWCGTFAESADDLPYLGESLEQPGIFHALGCGGNGTVYGMIAAEMLRNQIFGIPHPLTHLLTQRG